MLSSLEKKNKIRDRVPSVLFWVIDEYIHSDFHLLKPLCFILMHRLEGTSMCLAFCINSEDRVTVKIYIMADL